MSVRACVVYAGIALLSLVSLGRGVAEAQVQQVVYNHLKDSSNRAFELNVSDGAPFNIVIESTCEEEFNYEITAYERPDPPQMAGTSAGAALKPLATKNIPMVHDDRYGGYFVAISRKPTVAAPLCTGSEQLRPRTLIISTPLNDWDLAFSGGFTLSSLTNPVFYLRSHPSNSTQKQVQEDPSKQDQVKLGIATFVHMYHRVLPQLGGMFGLGIREGNSTEYFLGAGYRFSDKATLNAGVAFGPVSRLPDGVDTTGPVTNDNVLNSLPTRVKRGFFVGLSYSFINVRGKLQQPFAGAPAGGTPPAAAATPPAAPAAPGSPPAQTCTVTASPTTLTFPATGGAQEVTVTVGANCPWNVRVAAGSTLDVNFKPEKGSGSGKFEVVSKPTGGTQQKGNIDVNGAMIAVTRN